MTILHKTRSRSIRSDRSLQDLKKEANLTSVTKEEALTAMENGRTVYHNCSDPEEYFHMDNDHIIYDHDGYDCGNETGLFWLLINCTGWHILPKK